MTRRDHCYFVGTRASTLAVRDTAGRVSLQERGFGPGGAALAQTSGLAPG